MIKGNIEELFGFDLGLFAVAAANDCSRRLVDYVNIDVVNAIQWAAAKTWISNEPYDRNACSLGFNLLLFNSRKLDIQLMEAILRRTKVLNLKDERSNMNNAAVALALYNRYLKPPSVLELQDSMPSEFHNETNILLYDGPLWVCSEDMRQHQGLDTSNMWWQYLNPKSNVI